MNRYDIISAGADDLQMVHDMAEVVFRHTYRDILSAEQMEYMMEWMYSLPSLHQQLKDGHVYYIGLGQEDRDSNDGRAGQEDRQKPSGYVSIQPDGLAEDGRLVYHLQKIYVMPSAQGSGLGRVLFETAIEHIRTASGGRPARIELNVNRNNPAVGFYKHLGMKLLRQGDFPIGNGFYMNDFIMGLDLD